MLIETATGFVASVGVVVLVVGLGRSHDLRVKIPDPEAMYPLETMGTPVGAPSAQQVASAVRGAGDAQTVVNVEIDAASVKRGQQVMDVDEHAEHAQPVKSAGKHAEHGQQVVSAGEHAEQAQ